MGSNNSSEDYSAAINTLLDSIRSGDTNAVKTCLAKGADIDGQEVSTSRDIPLIAAVDTGNLAMVKYLIDSGAVVNRRRVESPLSKSAVTHENPEMTQLLLDNGANPNTALNSASVLSHVCYKFNVDETKMFNEDGRNTPVPISDAAYETAAILLKAGARPDGERGHVPAAPIEGPIMANDLRTINLLLDNGAKLTSVAILGAANYCAEHCHAEALELILSRGWKPNPKKVKNKAPASPLNYAVSQGYLDIIELLAKYKINLDYYSMDLASNGFLQRLNRGHSVNVAIVQGQHDSLSLLLKSGASHTATIDDDTDASLPHPLPIVLASYLSDIDSIEILLEHNADVNATAEMLHVYGEYKACDSKTALEVASENEDKEVIDFLIENGAKPK